MSLFLLVPMSLASLTRSQALLIQESCFVLQSLLQTRQDWAELV